MWPGSGYEDWFLVEDAVFEHAVDHVASAAREADDGGVVALALFAFALVVGDGRRVFCFASMFVRQVRQCFSVVWADGFPRCRHRFPVM